MVTPPLSVGSTPLLLRPFPLDQGKLKPEDWDLYECPDVARLFRSLRATGTEALEW